LASESKDLNSGQNRSGPLFRRSFILPLIATAFILYRSQIPGGSDLNSVGIVAWVVIILRSCWLLSVCLIQRIFPGPDVRRELIAAASLLLISVIGIVKIQLLVFQAYRGELVAFVNAHMADSDKTRGRYQVGPYTIIRYVKDEEGGMYLVTTERLTSLGPDMTEFGFAFRPAHEAKCVASLHIHLPLRHLDGDWWTF